MSSYDARVVDIELDELLADLPAVSLDGPKGVGKTATASRRVATTFRLDDEVQRELLRSHRRRLDRVPGPVLIDEWQRMPESWDMVRRAVDEGAEPGRYLLTGSASPTTAPTHSGAGRIIDVRMRPMSLSERSLEAPTVSLADMLRGMSGETTGQSHVTLSDYANEIVRSGFPGIRNLGPRTRDAALDGYIRRIVEHDFPEQGHLVRRPETLRRWLRAYAAATSTTASYNAILDAATPGDHDKPAKTTTIGYRDVLSQLWLLDPVPGWIPMGSTLAKLGQAPKHHLADPALAARLMRLTTDTLHQGVKVMPSLAGPGPLLGALFESLVTLDVKIYAQAARASVNHLRTHNGNHEVDLIVEGRDASIVALEVKLSPVVRDDDVRHLKWLREQIGDRLVDSAVITTGQDAYRREDGIAVIPAVLLGP